MQHCCKDMNTHLSKEEMYLSYSPQDRMYSIPYKKKYGGGQQAIYYCPWCGKKLPKELRDEFFSTLKKEYDLEISFLEVNKAPKEFQSDEWWKKRGL